MKFLISFDFLFSIVKSVRNDNKWFKSLFYICINEVLDNIKDISGVIIHQKLITLGIGHHILTICKLDNIPCIILSNNEEMTKWISNSNLISCIGIRKVINKDKFAELNLKESVLNYESIRSKLEELFDIYKSSYEVPYLILDKNNEFTNEDFDIIAPLVRAQIVESKIDYPKSMKRSERRKLRKERRKRILNDF